MGALEMLWACEYEYMSMYIGPITFIAPLQTSSLQLSLSL